MKPSDFRKHPYESVTNNMESEMVARNIMVILTKTGDEWRKLSWEEYAENANHRVVGEKPYFDKVVNHCSSEEKARLFSPTWKEIN